ncbi:MAG TPA: hypothetical protein PL066_00935 [bacterium]|nr:hypothetical protein [bacterium]
MQDSKAQKKEPVEDNKLDLKNDLGERPMHDDFSAYRVNRRAKDYYAIPFYKSKLIYALLAVFLASVAFIFWSINRPETTIVNPNNNNQNPTVTGNASVLFFQGDVYISQDQKVSWKKINSSVNLNQNDSIKTIDNAWAIIKLPEGAFVRLDANTEISLSEINKENISIEQSYGQAFHYTNKGQKPLVYKVTILDWQFTALNEMFNSFNNRQNIQIQNFDGSMEWQRANGKSETSIGAKQLVINLNDNTVEEKELVLNKDLFNYQWINWNNQQNKGQNLNLISLPFEENWPESLELSAEPSADGTIKFNWTYDSQYEGVPPYGLYLIMGDKEDPSYPQNTYVYINSADLNNEEIKNEYLWANLEDGEYHFRLGVFDGIKEIVKYSNNVKIKLPANEKSTLLLEGAVDETRATLNWTAENLAENSSWKLLIAENTTPIYPLHSAENLNRETMTYTWRNLSPGKTYQFRLCEYDTEKNECLSYSNTVTVNVGLAASDEEEMQNLEDNNVPQINLQWQGEIPQISWTKLSSSKRYLLQISAAFSDGQAIEINPSQNYYLFTGYDNSKTYFASLCVIDNNQNCLQRSNELKIMMP